MLNIFGSPGTSEKNAINRNLSAFIFCLLISALCWFLIMLSREYQEQHASFKVEYINLPKDKALINRLPDSIHLELNTSGFSILKEKIFSGNHRLKIDCSKLRPGNDNISFLPSDDITLQVTAQLGNDYTVTKVIPDTLFFNFGARATRLVPVKLNLNLGFAKQFQLSDSIRIDHPKILVSGAREMIGKLDHVSTDYMVLNDLERTVTVKLGFAENGHGLGFSPDSIKVTIPVDRFTEGKTEVTVEPINVPPGYTLKIFPDRITLRYMVGISDISRVNESLFRVVVDYAKAGGGSKLKAEVLTAPGFVHDITFDPEIEFILRKK